MIESLQQARKIDPRSPRRIFPLIGNLIADHRYDEASVESENYGLRDYWSSYFYTLLLLREHRDMGRLAAEMMGLTKDDMVPQVKEVISAMDFFDKSQGANIIFI